MQSVFLKKPRPLQTLVSTRHFSQSSTTGEHQHHQQESDLSSHISALVLRHTGDAQTLSQTLLDHHHHNPAFLFSSTLVNRVLKRLWDDGPKALFFFHSLLLLPPHHHHIAPSSFDHALDIAARLRDRRATRWLLSLRVRRLGAPPTRRTFAVLFERFVSAGKPDRAIRLFLSMHHHGCPQDLSSFNTLLDVLCKSRRVEKAQSFLGVFRCRFPPDAVTYNILAAGWCRIKQTSTAMETLKEMVESGVEPTPSTYNILLKGFFESGQVKQALEFFSQMKKRSKEGFRCVPDVVSYTTVLHGLGLVGQIEKARQVFDEMLVQGCLPSVATYNALIQVICKKGSVQDAILVFEEMVRKGYTPNVITYNLVVRGLCHAGEMDGAMEFMERMKREGCEPNVQTYNVVIRYWCEAGEVEKGLDLFGKMGVAGACLPNKDTFNILISAMFVRKRAEDMLVAGKLVAEMVERGHLPRRFMFNRVLNGLLLTGNQAFAKDFLRVQSRCSRLTREIRLFSS